MIALVHVVHQPERDEPLRHRIGQRARAPALGQSPSDARLGAGIAGIAPIAVPAGLRTHHEGERERSARLHNRMFSGEADIHVPALRRLRARRHARDEQGQQGEEDNGQAAHGDAAIAGFFRGAPLRGARGARRDGCPRPRGPQARPGRCPDGISCPDAWRARRAMSSSVAGETPAGSIPKWGRITSRKASGSSAWSTKAPPSEASAASQRRASAVAQ